MLFGTLCVVCTELTCWSTTNQRPSYLRLDYTDFPRYWQLTLSFLFSIRGFLFFLLVLNRFLSDFEVKILEFMDSSSLVLRLSCCERTQILNLTWLPSKIHATPNRSCVSYLAPYSAPPRNNSNLKFAWSVTFLYSWQNKYPNSSPPPSCRVRLGCSCIMWCFRS